QRFVEHKPNVLERAALPLRVPHREQWGISLFAEEHERVGAQSWSFAHAANARALDGFHIPAAVRSRLHERHMLRAQGEPRLTECERVVEIGQGVQLYRSTIPRLLDARAHLG